MSKHLVAIICFFVVYSNNCIFGSEATQQPCVKLQDLQQLFNRLLQENIKEPKASERSFDTLSDAFEGAFHALTIAGEPKKAHQIAVIGQAGLKVMQSWSTIATEGIAGAMAVAASPLAPFVGIASAVALLVSLSDNTSDPFQELSQQISTVDQRCIILDEKIDAIYQALTNYIEIVYDELTKRFDGLESKVDRLQYHLVQCFLQMSQQLQDYAASSSYSFERIEQKLQILHSIASQVNTMLLSPIVDSCATIEQCESLRGSFENMPEPEVITHTQVLENYLKGINPAHTNFNGALCSDFSADTLNQVLTINQPETILGYLANHLTLLGHPVPDVRAEQIPNLGIYIHALEKYLKLRKKSLHVVYDEHCLAPQSIAHIGQQALTFITTIQTNRTLFTQLLENYFFNLEKIKKQMYKAFEKKSMELLETVHTSALQRNREAIATMSDYYHYLGKPVQCLPQWQFVRDMYSKMNISRRQAMNNELEQLQQNKPNFKISLTDSSQNLLSNKKILNFVIMPDRWAHKHHPYSQGKDPFFDEIVVPLNNNSNGAHIIENYIPDELVLAERLGLGIIDLSYYPGLRDWTEGFNPNEPITLYVDFKDHDNVLHPCGLLQAEGLCTGNNINLIQARDNIFATRKDLGWFKEDGSRSPLDDLSICMREIRHNQLTSKWSNAHIILMKNFLYQGVRNLPVLISQRIAQLRRQAIASLSDPTTKVGTRFQKALNELNASYNTLQTYGTIAGMMQPDVQVLKNLMDKTRMVARLKEYVENPRDENNPLLQINNTQLPLTTSTGILDRCCMPRENSFSTPLRIMLAKLGHFALTHPEIVQQRKQKELMQHTKETQKAALERESLKNEITDLKSAVVTLSKQIKDITITAAIREDGLSAKLNTMTVLIQQLLAQKTGHN